MWKGDASTTGGPISLLLSAGTDCLPLQRGPALEVPAIFQQAWSADLYDCTCLLPVDALQTGDPASDQKGQQSCGVSMCK